MKRWGRAAVVLAMLLTIGTPVSAEADELLEVRGAFSASDESPGTISVAIRSGAPITAIRAEVRAEGSTEPLAVVTDFALRSQDGDASLWASARPVVLSALGDYSLAVEVTDADGDTVRRDDAGTLFYYVRTFIEGLRTDRQSIDYYHREVTARGVLKGTWPGTGEVVPLAGFTVDVGQGLSNSPVVTAADGSFSVKVTPWPPVPEVNAMYLPSPEHPFYEQSEQARVTLTVTQRPTRVTAALSTRRAAAGSPVTITGTVLWRTSRGWRPLADAPFLPYANLCDDTGCDATFGPVGTDAAGRYVIPTTAIHTGHYRVVAAPSDPFLASSITTTRTLTVTPAAR